MGSDLSAKEGKKNHFLHLVSGAKTSKLLLGFLFSSDASSLTRCLNMTERLQEKHSGF